MHETTAAHYPVLVHLNPLPFWMHYLQNQKAGLLRVVVIHSSAYFLSEIPTGLTSIIPKYYRVTIKNSSTNMLALARERTKAQI